MNIYCGAYKVVISNDYLVAPFFRHGQTPGAALSSIDDLLCTGLKYYALSVLVVKNDLIKSAKGAIQFSPGQAVLRRGALGL